MTLYRREWYLDSHPMLPTLDVFEFCVQVEDLQQIEMIDAICEKIKNYSDTEAGPFFTKTISFGQIRYKFGLPAGQIVGGIDYDLYELRRNLC